jgi:hypothetical protein
MGCGVAGVTLQLVRRVIEIRPITIVLTNKNLEEPILFAMFTFCNYYDVILSHSFTAARNSQTWEPAKLAIIRHAGY